MAELRLEIVEGAGAGQVIELDGPLTFGREPGNTVVLDDTEVSRRHARIEPVSGGAEVADLGSRNGTHVNGQPLAAPRLLQSGDEVRIGKTVLAVQGLVEATQVASGVRPVPPLTQVGAEVLRPADPAELRAIPPDPDVPAQVAAPAPAEAVPAMPELRVGEQKPGYVETSVLGRSLGNPTKSDRLAALVDARVKQKTNVAAFAYLVVVALAVAIYFGVR